MPETNTPQPDDPGGTGSSPDSPTQFDSVNENTPEGEGARDMHDEVVLPEKKFTSGDGGVSGLKKSTIALSFLAGAALAGGVAALATFDLGSHSKVVADPGASPTSVSASPFPSQSSASGSASHSSSPTSTSSSPSKSAGGSPTSSAPGGSQTAAPSGGPSRPSSGASSSTPSSSSQVSPSTGSSSTGSGSQSSSGPATGNDGSGADSGSTSASTGQDSNSSSNAQQSNSDSNTQPPRRPSRTPGTPANIDRITSTWRSHVDTLRSGVSRYTVQDGDTLSELAQVMGTSVEQLAALNHIRDIDLIRTGQSLRLPLGVHR